MSGATVDRSSDGPNVIEHHGARPVFADIDRRSHTIDVADVERRITPKTRAFMPVHFGGRPCAMDDLYSLANEHGIQIMTPAYEGDPESPKVVPREQWFNAPAKHVAEPESGKPLIAQPPHSL